MFDVDQLEQDFPKMFYDKYNTEENYTQHSRKNKTENHFHLVFLK